MVCSRFSAWSNTMLAGDSKTSPVTSSVVPGDIVLIEAGDLVPADGRVLTSATLEVQEAALTGESAPVAKDAVSVLPARPHWAIGSTWFSRTRR